MERNILECMELVGSVPPRFAGEKIYVSTGALDCDHIDYDATEQVSYENRPSRANLVAEPGDILFAKMCATKKTLQLDEATKEYLFSTGFCAVRANKNVILPELLYYLVSSDQFLSQKDKHSSGATQKAVTNAGLGKIFIHIPALPEQPKIVAILDKLTGLISLRRKQLAKLDEAVKSQFIELFGSISETVPLSYYIASLSAGKSLAGEEECPNKVLKTGAVSYDYFDPEQVKNLPVDYKPQEDHRVKDGDVIISRMNTAELVGAAAYVWNAPEHTYLPDRLWKAAIKDTACPIFVWQALIQNSTKESIRRIASGTSGSMKNISKSELLGIRVRKVPLTQQEQFAVLVRQSDKSKFAIRQSLDKLELLKKSLMQQYFG